MLGGLFNKSKKNTQTAQTTQKAQSAESYKRKPKFALLGPYSERNDQCAKNVKQAMEELKIKDELVRVTSISEMASFGTMQSPSLAVEGRVVSEGVLITKETAKNIIMKTGVLF